jgi:hypothetical protein
MAQRNNSPPHGVSVYDPCIRTEKKEREYARIECKRKRVGGLAKTEHRCATHTDVVRSQEGGCVREHLTWKSRIQNKDYPEKEMVSQRMC